jgi:hypothetical protein
MMEFLSQVVALQENVVIFKQKVAAHDKCVRYTLWFHPLQCRICGVWCGIYYINGNSTLGDGIC